MTHYVRSLLTWLQTRSSRTTLRQIGLAWTAAVGLGAIIFIVLDWLQTLSGPIGSTAAIYHEQILILGAWLDFFLGTRVFQFPFTLRGVATGALIGILGPLLGAFLVHRQMALIGETLAHTAFVGVAIGVVLAGVSGLAGTSGQLVITALIVSSIAALGLQWLTAQTESYGDVPISIVLTGSFAVGTLLLSWGRDRFAITVDIEEFLFGDLAIVTATGTRLVAVLSVVVVALVVFNYKQFLFVTFDEQAAAVSRLSVRWYTALLIVLTAVVVVGAMQILGVILVAGLLVIPVAAASQVAQSFREVIGFSVILGQLSVLLGIGFAIWFSLPSGGAVIVVAILFHLAAIGLTRLSGW